MQNGMSPVGTPSYWRRFLFREECVSFSLTVRLVGVRAREFLEEDSGKLRLKQNMLEGLSPEIINQKNLRSQRPATGEGGDHRQTQSWCGTDCV